MVYVLLVAATLDAIEKHASIMALELISVKLYLSPNPWVQGGALLADYREREREST